MIVATILMDDLDCIRSAKDVGHADDAPPCATVSTLACGFDSTVPPGSQRSTLTKFACLSTRAKDHAGIQ